MKHESLLELVWQGSIQPAQDDLARRMSRLLRHLLPVTTAHLTASGGVDRTSVLPDETELMPALPLGDVLAEELNMELPYGTLVVLDERGAYADDEDISYHLGVVIAETLLGVLRAGIFPLERESDALYVMACSYHHLAAGAGFRHLGLVPGRFRAGLAASLGAYWSGAQSSRTETSGLFLHPDFLEAADLRRYLKNFDAGFSAPDIGRIPASLMTFPGGARRYEDWLGLVEKAVTAFLRPATRGHEQGETLTRRGL